MPRDIFAETAARTAFIKRRVGELDAQGKRAYQFKRPGGSLIVHEATRRPGTWQITRFDEEGEPVGHVESESRIAALTDAAKWYGADLGHAPRRR